MLKKVLAVFILWLSGSCLLAQDRKFQWVDSIFQTMSLEEKAGQLFVLPASSYHTRHEIEELIAEINDHHIGGIVITQGGPKGTVELINQLQKVSKVPLLTILSAGGGPGQVLDSLMTFPKMLNLGAITDDSLLYDYGEEIARQMKLLGLHMNIAPNADIDVMPDNPYVYLGTNKRRVSQQAISFVRGLQHNNVLASPSHQRTIGGQNLIKGDSDPIDFVNNGLDTSSFYPFHQLIKEQIDGISTSYLHFSVLDKKKNIPAPLSQFFISSILKQKLGFRGLTIAEIPYFHQLAGKSKNETEKLAFEVGHDLLLYPDNVNGAIKKIISSVKKNTALRQQLDESVRKILSAKYDAGLFDSLHSNPDNIIDRINSPEANVMRLRLVESSITLVKDEKKLIPIPNLEGKKFASVTIGTGSSREFERYLNKYAAFESWSVNTPTDTTQFINHLDEFDVIVVSLYGLDSNQKSWLPNWVTKLDNKLNVIVCSFGNPYDLTMITDASTVLVGYGDSQNIPMTAAQIIFGARQAKGALPIQLNASLTEGMGTTNATIDRFAYGIPEQVGMSGKILSKIDEIVRQAIDSGATPGCNILIAKDGQVIYNKAIGWKTYEKANPLTEETIYDLASITKVSATLQTVMFMYDKNLIDINKKVSVYLPELTNSNKKDFTIKDILTHQAGLWPYLPFWQQTIKDSTLLPEYYSERQSDEFPFPVAKNLFANKTMKDSLWQWIINAKVREKKPRTPYDYTYSDMGFYIMQHLAEKLLNQPMEDFLQQNIYEPIGAYTTGFLPLDRFAESEIAPTENDLQFRQSTLIGYVHDQGAAMHGGIAGHAGLFSDANDLAKLGQMWLQKGSYGGQQFFKPETVDFFTAKQYDSSRRGLGWDKPTVSDWNGPTSLYASPKTFGHTGFTGTAIWVDPEFNLVYVFLSNRVFPDMFNTKLLTANIRPRIQDVIYQSIFEYCKSGK